MIHRRTLLGALPLLPVAAAAHHGHGHAQPVQHQHGATSLGPLRIEDAWTRAALEGRQGAGFMTIRNSGTVADRLVAASSPVAGRMELHTHIRDGDVMRMRPVQDIPVPAGGSATLQPGGLHLMFMGLNRTLAEGTRIPVTLRFAEAGEVTLELEVRAAGARGGPSHRH